MPVVSRILLIAALPLAAQAPSARPPRVVENVMVYSQGGRFAGWPANHGAWNWGDELVVGFESGYFQLNPGHHAIDRARPAEHLLARSRDGGKTWAIERPESLQPPDGAMVAGVPAAGGKQPVVCTEAIEFTHPDFAMTLRMTSIHDGESRYYYSYDRGHSWKGPCNLPNFGQPGTAARTDYIVNGPGDLTALMAAAKRDRHEGRVIAVRTRDGGRSWNMTGFVGPEPEDFAIMPSTVRLGPAELVSAIRRRHWIDVWRSDDNGETWHFLNQAAVQTGGNPPSMLRLPDGRLVLTFGYRLKPPGIRARISRDNGLSWEKDIVLREDGGCFDLGYTRTLRRADGKLVTAYYYNDAEDKERYIAATIWDPGE
jgi:hypothetical protein